MEKEEALEERMMKLLEQAQKTLASHASVLERLQKMAHVEPNAFYAALCKLVVRLTVSAPVLPQARKLLLWLLGLSDVNEKTVRFRSVQLVAGILTALPEDYEIDEALWRDLQAALLLRVRDKHYLVRVEAVQALARLQNPTDREDPVMLALMERLGNDPSHDVRRAVLSHLALTRDTLTALLLRARDVNAAVRRRLYEVMAAKVELKALRIRHRRTLLLAGLQDRDPTVHAPALALARAWLRVCQGELPLLLQLLDVATEPEAGELLVRTLLKEGQAPPLELLGPEQRLVLLQTPSGDHPTGLTPELALLWRVLAEQQKELGAEEALEALLPDLPQLARFLRMHAQAHDEPVLLQLLHLARLVDKSDEAGRAQLSAVVRDLLPQSTLRQHAQQVPLLMGLLRELFLDAADLNELLLQELLPACCEIIDAADAPEPQALVQQQDAYLDELDARVLTLEQQLKGKAFKGDRAELQAELDRLRAESQAIETRELERLSVLGEAWARALHVLEEHLKATPLTLSEPSLAAVKDLYLKRALRWPYASPAVRRLAMRALGAYCMLERSVAAQHVPLFRHALAHDEELVQEAVLEVLFDFANLFGLSVAGDEDEAAALQRELHGCLNHVDLVLRRLAAEGFCKLLQTDQVKDRRVLGALVLLFFNPETGLEDPRLQQLLATFLKAYAYRSAEHQRLLASVLPQVVRAVTEAPADSPLKRVDTVQLLKILLELCHPERLLEHLHEKLRAHTPVAWDLHHELGAKFLKDLKDRPQAPATRLYLKSLATLHLSAAHQDSLRTLRDLALELRLDNFDAKLAPLVKPFLDRLAALIKEDPVPPTPAPSTPKAAKGTPKGTPKGNPKGMGSPAPKPATPTPSATNEKEAAAEVAELLRTVDRNKRLPGARSRGEELPKFNLAEKEEEEQEVVEEAATPETEVMPETGKKARSKRGAGSSGTIAEEEVAPEPKKRKGAKR